MDLIFCVSNDLGLTFNRRRVSRDEEIVKDIIKTAAGRPICLTEATAKLFDEFSQAKLILTDDFSNLPFDCICFYEYSSNGCQKLLDSAFSLTLYSFNRDYPSDEKLVFDEESYVIKSQETIIGKSHPQITKTVFVKGQPV